MKKVLIIIAAICLSVGGGLYAKSVLVPQSELPTTAKGFIATHFGKDVSVVQVEKDWNEYEVKLGNGVEIEFYTDGNWKSIETSYTAMPESVLKLLPSKIGTYISSNFKDATVTEVKKKRYGYEVELVNPVHGKDIELEFSHEGNLLKID